MVPTAFDFNGDGRSDPGVYQQGSVWYIDTNFDGTADSAKNVIDFPGHGQPIRPNGWVVDTMGVTPVP